MNEDSSDTPAVSYYQRRIRLWERTSFFLKVYSYLGIALFLVSGGYLLYSKLKIDLSQTEKLSLAISFMGAAMAGLSYGALIYRRAIYERDVERFAEHQAVGRFIEAWAKFEDASATAAFGRLAEDKRFSIRDTLRKLGAEGRLSVSDQITADSLLQMRNSLVHGARRFPVSELEAALNQLIKLLTKIS